MPEKKSYKLSTAAGRSDELIEIGGREFRADPFTLKEADRFEASSSYEAQLRALADPLTRRAVDGEEVSIEFLTENLTKPFLRDLLTLLVNGSLDVDPKA